MRSSRAGHRGACGIQRASCWKGLIISTFVAVSSVSTLIAPTVHAATAKSWLCAGLLAGAVAVGSLELTGDNSIQPVQLLIPGWRILEEWNNLQVGDLALGQKITEVLSWTTPAAMTSLSLALLIRGTSRSYFAIDAADFWRAIQELFPPPKHTLIVSGFSTDDLNYVYSINRIYDHAVEDYFFFSSARQLITYLKALPQNAQFDRIEIHSHGRCGQLFTTNEEDFLPRLIDELADLNVASPGATVVIFACSFMSGKPFSTPPRERLTELGRGFLKHSGHVVAATRSIVTTDTILVQKNLPLVYRVPMQLVKGAAVVVVAGSGLWPLVEMKMLLISNPWRNYRASAMDVMVEKMD